MVRVRRVPTEQAVVAKEVEVARLRYRFLGRGWDIVRVRQRALEIEPIEQVSQVAVIEAE